MVGAGEGGLVNSPLFARDEPHALMPTDVIKRLDLPRGIPQDNERVVAHLATKIITGLRNLQCAANAERVVSKDTGHFQGMKGRVSEKGGRRGGRAFDGHCGVEARELLFEIRQVFEQGGEGATGGYSAGGGRGGEGGGGWWTSEAAGTHEAPGRDDDEGLHASRGEEKASCVLGAMCRVGGVRVGGRGEAAVIMSN